jgi:glycosyltransferase involved in cell wall biosynthesis
MSSVSVIIPAFNRADLIGETIASVLAQDLAPLEVLVVNDGSTDATGEVIRSFGPPVREITIANSGQMVALNRGLAEATGEFVAFCDSDDLWRPEHLAAVLAVWQYAPEVTAAYANFRIVCDGAWSEGTKFDEAPTGFWDGVETISSGRLALCRTPAIARLLDFQPFFPSAMVVRADAFRALGGWDESVNRWMGQDFATALRVAEHPPIGVVLTPTVGIRKHEGNFSGDVQRMILGDAAILAHVLRTRPSLAPYAKAIGRSILARRADALEIAFARRDFAAVTEIAALAGEAALPSRARLKARLARLPAPLRGVVVPALLGLGTLCGGLRQG